MSVLKLIFHSPEIEKSFSAEWKINLRRIKCSLAHFFKCLVMRAFVFYLAKPLCTFIFI
ncbi:hypothetical protein HMPREF9441_02132 [Paraprevotella clara YIT 11840]|uniref:Uncharacterized protein n=1 Tax=Paraprevotella clara YIT 11840 TaxID=762968 RepID=G5SRY3_9BACT|nr:hypothetical protein HMPREF9441_02132 [Paraprevotella clara YIT 11840]